MHEMGRGHSLFGDDDAIVRTLEFFVDAVSSDLNDCRLQVVPQHGGKARWYRERNLNPNDEIEDRLIDARSGTVVWSSFRPTVGWYLVIKSPIMPKQAAVPLVPTKEWQDGGTPLSFSVVTSLDDQYFSKMTHSIEEGSYLTAIHDAAILRDASMRDERCAVVALDSYEKMAQIDSRIGSQGHARSTSRIVSQSHARHRSSGQHVEGTSSSVQASQLVSTEDLTGRGIAKPIEGEHILSKQPGSEPSSCRFLLVENWQADGSRANESWSSWAAGLLSAIPHLSVKNYFSLLWVDTSKNAPGIVSSTIEVLRYEQLPSWHDWRGRRQGKLLLQHSAIRALRIDVAFWISVALAYLEYIQERDGYHAAMDG